MFLTESHLDTLTIIVIKVHTQYNDFKQQKIIRYFIRRYLEMKEIE